MALWLARAVATENATRRQKDRLPPLRPYDLRHSFATWAASIIKDDRALKELIRTNRIARYTEGARRNRRFVREKVGGRYWTRTSDPRRVKAKEMT